MQFGIYAFGRGSRLSLAFVLNQGDPVSVVVVSHPNHNGITATGDENILFLVDSHTIFCDADERVGEIVKSVSSSGVRGKLG
jgi:hypothetical protein